MNELPIKIGVYGSLRKNHGNHRLLETSEYLTDAKTKGTMYSLGGFPALTLEGNTDVQLELYNVTDSEVLRSLDSLEGHPRWYTRYEVDTTEGPAWVYTMPAANLEGRSVVESGDWNQHTKAYL